MFKKPRYCRQRFTEAEDKKILSIVNEKKIIKWKEVAAQLKGKTAKQVRDRYNGYLKSPHENSPFTEDEDNIILEFVSENGRRWKELAQLLNGRSGNQVKNRYQMLHRSKNAKSKKRQKKEKTKKPITDFKTDKTKSSSENKIQASETFSMEQDTSRIIDEFFQNLKIDFNDPIYYLL